MFILDLPVEVSVIIFNYLDTKTKINFYNSSEQVREYFASGWCHLNSVVLSRNSIATVKTLHEKLFVNLGEYVRVLNLSGVQDLTVQNLKPHMNRFKNLKSLDITFTNIYLPDIGEVCPLSVKNIAINFFKDPYSCGNESTCVRRCREIFKERQFEVIHFVIFEFVVAEVPLKFLEGVPLLKDLKLTIFENYINFLLCHSADHPFFNAYDIATKFNDFWVIAQSLNTTYVFSRDFKPETNKLSTHLNRFLEIDQLEYIFIMYLETKHELKLSPTISIYVSPVFASMFTTCCNNLKVEVSSCLPIIKIDGNISFKVWNKATTIFDDKFFSKLALELKDYFPTYVCMHNQSKMQIVKAPSSWYCIDCCENFEENLNDLPDKVTLTNFCCHDGIVKRWQRPLSFSKECKMIRHITFLRINNVPLSKDFFANLFTACPKLVTLDVHVEKYDMIRGSTDSLSKVINKAKLKNFMLTSNNIEYEIIFEILSHCFSLENVHICEYESRTDEVNTTNIVNFVENCVNLYSLYIETYMTKEELTMLMAPIRIAAQTIEREYLCVKVCELYNDMNPFADVFNPSPLHILN